MRASRLLALARQLGGSPAVTDALQQPAWISAALGLALKPFSSGPSGVLRPPGHPQQPPSGRHSAADASSLTVGAPLPSAAAAAAQLQPRRWYAAASGRPAAVRRLRRASARAAVGVGSRGGGREAALARQEAGGGEVEAGPAHDVVVHEGPANSLQIASVVDHPALIVTRPVEWCATVWLGCATLPLRWVLGRGCDA